MTEQLSTEPRRRPLERFLGGSPAGVAIRLVLMSLVVGFFMSVFGVDAQGVVRGALDMVAHVLRDSTGLFGSLWGYVVTGAAIVLPVWLLMRLVRAR